MISVSLSMPTYFRASAWLYLQDRKAAAAAVASCTPHKRAHRKRGEPCTRPPPAAPRGTCNQRRAPLPPGWPSWQRSLSGGLHSPLQLQPERRHQRRAAPTQARRSRSTFVLPRHLPTPGATIPELLPGRNGRSPGSSQPPASSDPSSKARATAELSGALTSRNVDFVQVFEVLLLPRAQGNWGPWRTRCNPGAELDPGEPFPAHGLTGQGYLTFGIAVGVHRVIGKADFISFAGGVNNKIY